ncbi:MAG: hypothetical protein MRZ93_05205 [Lachnospiraceae bacterium]|nr:hypothetical protein [Lachnospiraceae bacterium]
MVNQTELLNVSDEMKLDDERQSFEGMECGEGLCSSSLDTTEELYSSSATDALRGGVSYCPNFMKKYVAEHRAGMKVSNHSVRKRKE